MRHRSALIEYRAGHIQRLQKALPQMNLQLTQALSDITGETGLAILRSIVAGQRDPVQLAQYRNPRCAKSEEEIAQALTGNYRPEHIFALKQALSLYDAYTEQLAECDGEIARQFQAIKPVREEALPPLGPSSKGNSHSKNGPTYDARNLLYQLTGVDLVAISGLNASTAQTIVGEVGRDLSPWPSAKHFCSWLGLGPHNEISGGQVLRRRTLKNHNRAGQAFRLAAQSASRSRDGFGAYYRRMRARLGPKIANVAKAHKIARVFYQVLKYGTPFRETSAQEYEQRARDREIASLNKKAAKLGLTVV